jgi:hypothetical protein
LLARTARIQQLRGRVAVGEGCGVDYYALLGVRLGADGEVHVPKPMHGLTDTVWLAGRPVQHDGRQRPGEGGQVRERTPSWTPSAASRLSFLHGFVQAFLSSTARRECPAHARCGTSGLWRGGRTRRRLDASVL